MGRIALISVLCLLLMACTVGVVSREEFPITASTAVPSPPMPTDTSQINPTLTPTSPSTLTPTPPSSATLTPPSTITPSPQPTATLTPFPTATAETSAGPAIQYFHVDVTEVDPGDTVTLTWEASGDRATICPSARFSIFTPDDCQDVPLSGTIAFTIPPEATFSVSFSLSVETVGASAPEVQQATVLLRCHTTWFFSDEPQAGACPTEAITSHAAAQYFEHGKMIWLEQLGRYFVFHETRLYEGDVRKQADFIYDPLETIRDTSSQINPPEGFYAPESGFGLVWRADVRNSPGYRENLGWALAPEFSYEAIFQCDNALPSGGIDWRFCHLRGPDNEVIVFHPLGGWYLLGEREQKPPPQY